MMDTATAIVSRSAVRTSILGLSVQRRNTLWVAALALSLRVLVCVYALHHFGSAWFFHRGTEMGFVAHALLSGQGFSSPFGLPSGPTALIAPAYPLFVAGIFRCTGMFTPVAALVLMSVNALLNTATIVLILSLARKLAGERAAMMAALAPACAPPLLWMPTIFWETSVSALLLLGCVALGAELTAASTRVRWSLVGAAFGVAGLVNPALLPALLAVALTARTSSVRKPNSGRSVAPKIAVAMLSFVLVFAPWPIRNYHTLHAFIPTRSTVGFELWMGNRDGATGYLDESLFPTFNATEFAHYQALGEVSYMAGKSSLARHWIEDHPATFAGLTLRRIARFWTGTGNQHGSLAFTLYAGFTTLGAAAGLWFVSMRSQRTRLLAGLLAAVAIFPLPYYLTHAEFRYRLVLDPVLCVLSAVALDRLLPRRRTPANVSARSPGGRLR